MHTMCYLSPMTDDFHLLSHFVFTKVIRGDMMRSTSQGQCTIDIDESTVAKYLTNKIGNAEIFFVGTITIKMM